MTELYSGYRERQEDAAQRAAWRAKKAAELTEATADWMALRDRLADNAQALAVLDLHQPVSTYRLHCNRCYDGADGGDHEVWPCVTYHVIKESTP